MIVIVFPAWVLFAVLGGTNEKKIHCAHVHCTTTKTSICDHMVGCFSTFNKFNVKALISLLWVCGIVIG